MDAFERMFLDSEVRCHFWWQQRLTELTEHTDTRETNLADVERLSDKVLFAVVNDDPVIVVDTFTTHTTVTPLSHIHTHTHHYHTSVTYTHTHHCHTSVTHTHSPLSHFCHTHTHTHTHSPLSHLCHTHITLFSFLLLILLCNYHHPFVIDGSSKVIWTKLLLLASKSPTSLGTS